MTHEDVRIAIRMAELTAELVIIGCSLWAGFRGGYRSGYEHGERDGYREGRNDGDWEPEEDDFPIFKLTKEQDAFLAQMEKESTEKLKAMNKSLQPNP